MSAPTPDCLLPTPVATPPSPRDFDIHRQNQIEHVSTRRLAEKFDISQTRVRQIVRRTSLWIAERLPAQSDLQREQQERLALALAADEYQHQAELLQTIWNASQETKYHRQLLRVIAAKARLGTLPGAIDELLPDEDDRGVGLQACQNRGAGLQACPSHQTLETRSVSEGSPQAHSASEEVSPTRSAAAQTLETRSVSEGSLRAQSATEADAAALTPDSTLNTPHSAIAPPLPFALSPTPQDLRVPTFDTPLSPPPPGACSPNPPANPEPVAEQPSPTASTPDQSMACAIPYWEHPDHLGGLRIFESRLLSMIANTDPSDTERIRDFNKSLADIRREIAEVEPLIRQRFPVLALTLSPDAAPQVHQELSPTPNDQLALAPTPDS